MTYPFLETRLLDSILLEECARYISTAERKTLNNGTVVLKSNLFKFYGSGFIYLFGVLRRFQHCTGHITTGSWKGRGNQYIQFARVLYCKLPTNGKQLPAFPLEAMPGTEPRPQGWEVRVLPLCHRGPFMVVVELSLKIALKFPSFGTQVAFK